MEDSSLVIRRIRARPVSVPMKLPLHTASGAIDRAALVLMDLETTAGIFSIPRADGYRLAHGRPK